MTHGTNAAYVSGCRCESCRRATWAYHKRLALDHHRGIRRLVDATGTRRRIEALGALGWTGVQIGASLGVSGEHVRQLRAQSLVTRQLNARMVAAFAVMASSLPPETTRAERHNASRQRNKAARSGWSLPNAWLDIDNPAEKPDPGYRASRSHAEIDPVLVDRMVAGDMSLARVATNAERIQIVARWVESGQSLNELQRLAGWKPERYHQERAA